MKNPFTGGPLKIVESGSLADYYETGGKEEDIPYLLRQQTTRLNSMRVNEHRRLMFEWNPGSKNNVIFEINVWVLRVSHTYTNEDFRFCYSSEGIRDQRILRGWNS